MFTHDSIGVGEDGPTHQPIEHYAALRAIPDLLFIRPADANETACAWRVAIENRHRPTILALSRQNLPDARPQRARAADGLRRGGLRPQSGRRPPELILLATGSEMRHRRRRGRATGSPLGRRVRLVSMPCWELFDEQPPEYRDGGPASGRRAPTRRRGRRVARMAPLGRRPGAVHTLDRFGASAPAEQLFTRFGFTVEEVVARARALLRS